MYKAGNHATLVLRAVATPAPGMSLDDLVAELEASGTPIFEVNHAQGTVTLVDDVKAECGVSLEELETTRPDLFRSAQ